MTYQGLLNWINELRNTETSEKDIEDFLSVVEETRENGDITTLQSAMLSISALSI